MASYDEFFTHADLMADMDDRDDRDDIPSESYYDGDFCEHGKYVGGCGIDHMCDWCESGISAAEAKRIVSAEKTRAIRNRAADVERILNSLLILPGHCVGILAADMAQRSSYIGNPRNRYGRH